MLNKILKCIDKKENTLSLSGELSENCVGKQAVEMFFCVSNVSMLYALETSGKTKKLGETGPEHWLEYQVCAQCTGGKTFQTLSFLSYLGSSSVVLCFLTISLGRSCSNIYYYVSKET